MRVWQKMEKVIKKETFFFFFFFFGGRVFYG